MANRGHALPNQEPGRLLTYHRSSRVSRRPARYERTPRSSFPSLWLDPFLRALSLSALMAGFAACGDSGGDQPDSGSPDKAKNEAAGQPCTMVETAFKCTETAVGCYGAGPQSSSCPGGVLCAGDGKGMTCAYSCAEDADCAIAGAGLVCMQGCKARVVNGYCVRPELRDQLLDTVCPTSSLGTTSVAGVASY
jgi:hypothetical protein